MLQLIHIPVSYTHLDVYKRQRPIWVIKCPAPEGKDKVLWGDYPYALALKKYLERLNCFVIIDTREDWGCEEGADVVLVLRGTYFYQIGRAHV